MANILLTGMFDQKKREFADAGNSTGRFERDFVDAVNYACGRITLEADLETEMPEITSPQDTVSLDAMFRQVLSDGVSLYLLEMGRRPAKGNETQPARLEARFTQGISMVYMKTKNDLQNGDDDDENDIIGLGALG
jgi:hypothetical protein